MLRDLDTVLNFLTRIIFIEFISLTFMWMNVIAICLNLFIAWVALFKGIQKSYGYGSIPINTIFSGMNINTSYFDVHQGYKVLTHCHIEF